MPNPNFLEISTRSQLSYGRTDKQSGRRTDRHGKIDSASDPDQEYIHLKGSETHSSTCYILSNKSSIPFHSTSKGYKH